jgi:hypothetical protein
MKTLELQGAALDWAVAKVMQDDTIGVYFNENGRPMRDMARHGYEFDSWEPSTNWSQGGPIIEREKLQLGYDNCPGGQWTAEHWDKDDWEVGPTPLIAAMRCFVASKLGDTVDIPKELT